MKLNAQQQTDLNCLFLSSFTSLSAGESMRIVGQFTAIASIDSNMKFIEYLQYFPWDFSRHQPRLCANRVGIESSLSIFGPRGAAWIIIITELLILGLSCPSLTCSASISVSLCLFCCFRILSYFICQERCAVFNNFE